MDFVVGLPKTIGATRQSAVARDTLRRPLTDDEHRKGTQDDRSYSRTQESEISQQFSRLPNPDMVMYRSPQSVSRAGHDGERGKGGTPGADA